jgi:DNA-binding transcriptional LysR family regulator
MGLIVFDRSSGGVRATQAGHVFLRSARSILEQMDALVATAHEAGRGKAGRITIGFNTSISAGHLRAMLIEYAQSFPGIEIGMLESSRTRLVTALRNGSVDVAIVTGEMHLLESNSMPLWSERVLLALPEGHQLCANETTYWTDLKGQTLLLGQRDLASEMQDLLIAKLLLPEDRPQIVRHDVSRESIKSLIDAGFGVGLAIEGSLGANFAGVVHKEVRDGFGPTRISHSANWRKDNDNPALAGLLNLLRERYPFSLT